MVRRESVTAFLALLMMSWVFCACMTPGKEKATAEARYRRLERELQRRQAQLDDAKERNFVLESKTPMSRKAGVPQSVRVMSAPIPFEPSAALERMSNPEDEIESGVESSTKEVSLDLSGKAAIKPQIVQYNIRPEARKTARVIPVKLPPYIAQGNDMNLAAPQTIPLIPAVQPAIQQDTQTSEQRLYSKVLESYRRHSVAETAKSLQLLLKTYPDSIYADNALYLGGLLSFEKGDLARAGEFMERVLREYPRGNKVVSALFAKAMIQKSQGRTFDARNILRGVRQHYPGSPEAARAVLELKFIEISANKKREG